MRSTSQLPIPTVLTVARKDVAFYEAKFQYEGKAVKRRIGPAWLVPQPGAPASGPARERFARRPGRLRPGFFDERTAQVRAAELVTEYVVEMENADQIKQQRRANGATFRELAHAYLEWLETVRGAAPSTMQGHRSDLAEPDVPYKRGGKLIAGHIMRALGDKPASKITTEDVEALLATVARTGVSARTINRSREIVCAAFNFGMKSTRFKLSHNPAKDTDRRRPRAPGALVFYTPDEIEALARALEDGLHRELNERHTRSCATRSGARCNCKPSYRARGIEFPTIEQARAHNRDARNADELADDHRDAEAVRVSAYTGVRLGELLALRVGDINWEGSALLISRAISAGVERGTKTGLARQVPLSDQAAACLARLLQREDFLGRDELVFCNAYGRPLDGSALRRRYKRAQDAIGLRPLRWHDLRHTFGSLLIAGGVDLVSVRDAMGHSQLTTTSRYLHARPATQRAQAFTAAFERNGASPLAVAGEPEGI
jgi:integrase